MNRPIQPRLQTIAAAVFVTCGFLGTSLAHAQSEAGPAYDAFNSAYLVQANGQTYYATTYTSQGTAPEDEWVAALDITAAEDVYQYNHSQSQRNLVISLLNTLATFNSQGGMFGNWLTDGYDDDLAWMANAFLRGYQLTGITSYLTEAEDGWNNGYEQGWDTTFAGGGIWESTAHTGKCALSNDPYIFEGVALYQATGDQTYLTKAEAIYSWVRTNLVTSTGQVNGCVNTNGLGASANAYDSGSFLTAAAELYRITGQQNYYNDAVLVADFQLPNEPLTNNQETDQNQWAYWFTRGLSLFATDANLWSKYQPFLTSNANSAWADRNDVNLTWNQWNVTTPDTSCPTPYAPTLSSCGAITMSSAVAIWQHMQPPAVNLSGNYEIQNVASGLAVQVQTSSTASNLPVVQDAYSGASNQLWTFVPTSGGYYHIQNVGTGEVMNASGITAESGEPIIQYPAAGIIPGNDQWLPVENPDGTYSFFNLNSLQALDDPGESTQAGLQLDQYFGNSTSAQSFTLIAQ